MCPCPVVRSCAAQHSRPASPPRVNQGYVTHGLGVTGLPFRLGIPAEMTVFEFETEESVWPVGPKISPPYRGAWTVPTRHRPHLLNK